MGIYKLESGLIFDDQFLDIDPRWINSPSGSVSLTDNMMSLEHSDGIDGTKALFEIPSENKLLFQVEADYVPTELGDEGGIIIWNSALNRVEFLESVEFERDGEYPVWQARKRGNIWSFFAQRSSNWELFDSSVLIDPPMMGVALKGKSADNFQPLKIKRAILCKGSTITVGNLGGGYKVELLDPEGLIVRTQIVPNNFGGTEIELPTIPFNGHIKIYDVPDETHPEGRLLSEQIKPVEFFGGDVFLHGTDLQIVWKGEELNKDGTTHLGTLQNNIILTKMSAKNVTTANVAENIELAIKQFKEEFGWEWVDVANDVGGTAGDWLDVIDLGTLLPGEEIDFWVKVEKNYGDWSTKPTHFIFDLNHQ